MNPLSSPSTFDLPMAPQLNDVRQQNSILRSKILKNEQERLQLEQKLRLMMMKTLPNHQRRQIQHIQTYFTRLNHDSQRAEQRNLTLLHELTEAQQRLDQLHNDAENLMQLKNDYLAYLERHYPNWQRPASSTTDRTNEYNRLQQQIRPDYLNRDGNLRQASIVRQSYDLDSSMLYKRYEDLLKVRFDRTMSPVMAREPMELKDEAEKSQSESNEIVSNLSRMRRAGSLRMDLTSSGLILLCDYLETELQYTIDKTQIYSDDNPSLTQKREIINIANRFDQSALKDFGAPAISMIILDQLHSTIRRNTVNQCFFTDEILSFTFSDLDKDSISEILPEHDRSLWLRLIEHFGILLKLHIMDVNTLVEKFALCFLTTNIQDLQVKAKSLLRHVMQKYLSKQSSRTDDSNPKNNEEQSISSTMGNRSELFDQSLQ